MVRVLESTKDMVLSLACVALGLLGRSRAPQTTRADANMDAVSAGELAVHLLGQEVNDARAGATEDAGEVVALL